MKVKTITVERLYSLPGYNNIKLGATAEIEEGENVSQAFNWLFNSLNEKKAAFDANDDKVKSINRKIVDLDLEIKRLKRVKDQFDRVDDFDPEDDLPF